MSAIFIVIKYTALTPDGHVFEIQGAYDTEFGAIVGCTEWNYGYCELPINTPFPDETTQVSFTYPKNPK